MNQHERDYVSDFAFWLLGVALSVVALVCVIGLAFPAQAAQRRGKDTVVVTYATAAMQSFTVATYAQCQTQLTVAGAQGDLQAACALPSLTYRPTVPTAPAGALATSVSVGQLAFADCWLLAVAPLGSGTRYDVVCPYGT